MGNEGWKEKVAMRSLQYTFKFSAHVAPSLHLPTHPFFYIYQTFLNHRVLQSARIHVGIHFAGFHMFPGPTSLLTGLPWSLEDPPGRSPLRLVGYLHTASQR